MQLGLTWPLQRKLDAGTIWHTHSKGLLLGRALYHTAWQRQFIAGSLFDAIHLRPLWNDRL